MGWEVTVHKHALKRIAKMPKSEREKFEALTRDLRIIGPILPHWPNYSKLGASSYHCHLSYRWVACWEVRNKALHLIDVTYVGSREDAPY